MVVPVQKLRVITARRSGGAIRRTEVEGWGKKGLENGDQKKSSGRIREDKVQMLRRKKSEGKIVLKGNK